MESNVLDAVRRLMTSEFGVTGIKIELEAVFGRGDYTRYCSVSNDCDYYRDDDEYCETCDGDERITCSDCDGDGNVRCSDCQGRGQRLQLSTREMVQHRACRGTGEVQCETCNGEGEVACPDCDESHPRVTCTGEHLNGGDMASFNDYFLSKLVDLGLAEASEEGYMRGSRTLARHHRPIGALKYCQFYVDHSVDTECTFTLSVEEDPTVVLKLPEIVRAFTSIAGIIGSGIDVRGAGMHMALLNSRRAIYPTESFDDIRFRNFQRSMTLLMPALFFLGSANDNSRGLHYRKPYVNTPNHGSKYWAINYAGGALEFRIFETCYDRPEAILDNIVVMSKCMKHWTEEYTPHGLSRITRRLKFGIDNSNKLDRFYKTKVHFDLLFAGLNLLKPDYYTIEELCAMRNFAVTPANLEGYFRESDQEIERLYNEHCERYDKIVSIEKARIITHLAHERKVRLNTCNRDILQKLHVEADEMVKSAYTKLNKSDFIKRRQRKNEEGAYTLEEA